MAQQQHISLGTVYWTIFHNTIGPDYFHMLAEFQATQHNGVKLFLIEHCYFSLAFSQDFFLFFFNMNSYFMNFTKIQVHTVTRLE